MRILCFDIGGTFIKYGVLDDFKFTYQNKVPTDANKGGEYIINGVIDIAKQYSNIERIAISTAGEVDSNTGTIVHSTGNIPNYTGLNVKALVENSTGVLTYVENDVNSAAVGEAQFGSAKGYSDFVCLTYGTGVGGALYINNALYKGSNNSAAELGHIVIHSGGKECTCGGEGCYECYASANALISAVNRATGEDLDGVQIFSKKYFERVEVRCEIDKWIDEIIVGLINIIYTINPPLIVLGGGIMNEDYVIDLIDRKIYNQLMPNYRNVKIVRAKLGNTAGMLGAAFLSSNM